MKLEQHMTRDEWLCPKTFAMLLGILVATFFPDILFGGKSFMFRDFGIFTYPNAYFLRECFWRWELPLWNPLNNTGIPFLAQWNTVCLYPFSLIYLLLPLTWGLSFFLLFHLFLAGFGMYLLASKWTENQLAAGVAGIAYCFGGMYLNSLMWLSHAAALAWMPWVILLVEQAWSLGGRKRILIAGLAGGVQMLSGVPEIIAFTWLLLFLFWSSKLASERKVWRELLLRAVSIVAITGLLASAQLLPFFDLLCHSERSTSYGGSIWSIPKWGWANLVLPLFHCYKSPLGVYFQSGQDVTSSYYFGAGIFVLGITALTMRCTARTWFLAGVAIFGFLVSLGNSGYLYPILMKLFPFLGFMRYPIKFVYLTTFCFPLLAAYGVAHIRNHDLNGVRISVITGTFIILLIAGLLAFSRNVPYPFEEWFVLFENGLMRAVFLVLVLGTLVIAHNLTAKRLHLGAGLLLLIFIWLDLITHTPQQNPTVDASVFTPGLLAQKITPTPKLGETRALMSKESHDFIYGAMLTNAFNDCLGRRCALFGNLNILDGIPVSDGFYSLYIKEQRHIFMSFLVKEKNNFPEGFADFLCVSQISDRNQMLSWQTRSSHLPFVFAGAKPQYMDEEFMPSLLLSNDFNPRKIVCLPLQAKGLQPNSTVSAQARTLSFSPQKIEIEVDAADPTMLVLSQTYYHPWRAFVDGQPAKIWRANYSFQAVAVPKGKSCVKLIYEDHMFLLGLALSGVTLISSLILLSWPNRTHIAATTHHSTSREEV